LDNGKSIPAGPDGNRDPLFYCSPFVDKKSANTPYVVRFNCGKNMFVEMDP